MPGYDIIMQGETGLISVTGTNEDNLARVGNSTIHIYAGYITAIMILSALLKKSNDLNFDGMKINIPLYNAGLFSMTYLIPYYSFTKKDPKPMGISHPGIVPYQKFETRDKPIIIAVANNNIWKKFTIIKEFSPFSLVPEYSSNEGMVANRVKVVNFIQ